MTDREHGDEGIAFRDNRLGVEARRNELLKERRDDYAEMPPQLRDVFVARAGRVGVGIGALLVGGAAVLCAAAFGDNGEAPAWIANMFAGWDPAILATLTFASWVCVAFAHSFAKSVGERVYAKKTNAAVLKSESLYQDVERFAHESPVAVGQRLTRKVEGASVAGPVLAASLLLPSAFLWLRRAIYDGGYPKPGDFEIALSNQAGTLLIAALVGVVAAAALRIRVRVPSPLGWRDLLVGAGATALSATLSLRLAVSVFGILFVAGWMLRRARAERAQIGTEGQGALDEPLADVARALYRRVAAWRIWGYLAVPLRAAKRRPVVAVMATGLVVGGYLFAEMAISDEGPAQLAASSVPVITDGVEEPTPLYAPSVNLDDAMVITHGVTENGGYVEKIMRVPDGTWGALVINTHEGEEEIVEFGCEEPRTVLLPAGVDKWSLRIKPCDGDLFQGGSKKYDAAEHH